jgi:hypothetical protein
MRRLTPGKGILSGAERALAYRLRNLEKVRMRARERMRKVRALERKL